MESWQTSLCKLLDGLSDQQLLLIGSDPDTLSSIASDRKYDTLCVSNEQDYREAFPDTRRIACAVLIGLLENLPRQDGLHILAQLRDVHAQQLIVVVPIQDSQSTSQWRQSDFIGMGMKRHSQHLDHDPEIHIYTFSIRNYKATPDWLNSQYWANPQLFGKFRW